MKNRILLIGKRERILKKLSKALEAESFETSWVNNINDMSQYFLNGDYDLIAFGRGILRFDKDYLKKAFRKQNPDILFVDGLAPITELLVAQVNHAFAIRAGMVHGFTLLPFEKTNQGLKMNFVLTRTVPISVSLFRLDFLYRLKQETITFGNIPRGHHSIMMTSNLFGKRKPDFIVVRNGHVIIDVQPLVFKE